MTPLQKFSALCAGTILGLIVLIIAVDLIRGINPPPLLVAGLIPTFGGIMAGLLAKARNDKDDG